MILQVNDIHYFVEVKGEGDPLVFLHGFTGDTTTWSRITDQLSVNFRCVSIDLIGHGRTESPKDATRYTMERGAADICSLLDKLDIANAVLVGYSMGGRMALHFSLTYPEKVKALILESASPGLRTSEEREDRRKKDHALADRIEREGIEDFVDFWQEIPLFASQKRLSDGERSDIRQQRLNQSATGLSNSLKGMGTGAQDSLWDRLDELTCPVRLLVGELDHKFIHIAGEMKKLNPDFQILTFSNTGHAIHVEESRKFGTIIEELLFTT
ncbi:2-succinyl-6-hydroxy-2,4-cyclohexadiene-1-carboxylate synthase [Rossellomorea vietnamensis]|uniref:2-succinyl-6-hydroxy-2, 4-cyclohexadiene-1-carboxylate synthase n=1 Tax=Rossellomorea vietnamensis TaxID=218284 RepID=UPI003089DAB8|nr:2-succinyl-6-hydroxy-2,4-cyclohexadiene-1-carboxylate synthase [Rossellomorea vietnamensis]